MLLKHSKDIGYLGKAKMKAMLFVAILDAIQNIVMEATDRLIVGNLIGSDAVSGEMLIDPALTLGTVFEVLVSSGAAVLYMRSVGEYDRKRSREILGMASVLAVAFGILMCAGSFLLGDLYFDLMGEEGVVRTYGEQYFFFYRFTFLITPLMSLLTEIVYIDGDEVRALMANVAMLFGNAVLSLLLALRIGMYGVSLGSAIGTVLAFFIVISHFAGKRYRFRPIFRFRMADFREMLIIGGTDGANNVFDFVYSFLLNIFILRFFGEDYLAVLAVTSIIYEMMDIGGGVNEAMKTMLLSYRGDRNTSAMKSLVLYGFKITLIMGAVFIAAIWIAAPLFPMAYGIEGELVGFTAWACRLTALSAIACVFNGVFLEYYLDIGRYKLQLFGNALDSLVVRLTLNVLFAGVFGAIGIWVGESICTYASVVILLVFIYRHYDRADFPFLVKDRDAESLNLSFRTLPEEIVEAREKVRQFLERMKVPHRATYRTMLFLEDIGLLIRNNNPEEEIVNIDAYFDCYAESMNVVLWYDGKMMDLSDIDKLPASLADYTVSFLIKDFGKGKYQDTSGLNRVSFELKYRRLSWEENRGSIIPEHKETA